MTKLDFQGPSGTKCLECNEECHQLERNRRLAEALNIEATAAGSAESQVSNIKVLRQFYYGFSTNYDCL